MIITRFVLPPSLLLLFGIAVALLTGPAVAEPPSYPLYCRGPLTSTNGEMSFIWATSAAGAKGPPAGQCTWADRAARGSELDNDRRGKRRNTICGDLGQLAKLGAAQFMEIGVYRDDAHNNCMRVTQRVGIVQPPFSDSPTLPALAPYASCGMDASGSGGGQVSYDQVYASNYATWCVDQTIWSANEKAIAPFFTNYDFIVATLAAQFKINLPQPVELELTSSPAIAFCACTIFGSVMGLKMDASAFSSSFTNPKTGVVVPGFWGWIAPLHESFNLLTGQVSGGWPTDWWADDISPFPNAMDIAVLKYLGNISSNQTLLNASAAQQERFYDMSQTMTYDPRVVMFGSLTNSYGRFAGYARMFKLVQQDQLNWVMVAQDPTYTPDHNYSALLSEYVIAYLSMGFGTTTDLTQTFVAAGIGSYNQNGVMPYTVSSTAVRAIATAHCSIRAATGASAQLAALQAGNYASALASGGSSATCPSECKWSNNQCIAKW
jgi:hypothetical protein